MTNKLPKFFFLKLALKLYKYSSKLNKIVNQFLKEELKIYGSHSLFSVQFLHKLLHCFFLLVFPEEGLVRVYQSHCQICLKKKNKTFLM